MFHWVKIDDLITCEDVRNLEDDLSVTFAQYGDQLSIGQDEFGVCGITIDRDVLVAILPFLKHFALTGELPEIGN